VLWFFGLAIYSFYSQNPDPRVQSPDTVFFTFIATQLPTPLPGIMFAAMLAAVMSTLDSGMNSLSAVWLKEIHQKFINKNMDGHDEVRVSRVMTFVIGAFAVGMGLVVCYTSGVLQQSVVEAQTIFAALDIVILPAFIFAVLSRRANSHVIWTFAFLCWGINFGMVNWYWSSHQGLTGAIPAARVVVPAALACVIWFAGRFMRESSIARSVAEHLGLAIFGYAGAVGFWHFYAGVSGGGELSFMWTGVPAFLVFFVGGSIATRISRPQPAAKFQGLTLKTMNQAIEIVN
jgi:Na+/proline symporter